MSSTNFAIELNDTSLAALQKGEHQRAASLLGNALRTLKMEIDHHCNHDAISASSKQALQVNIVAEDAIKIAEEEINYGSFRLFNRPFAMSSVNKGCMSSKHHHQLSSIVLYNLGLLHHIRGIVLGKSKNLQKALQFYKLSFTLVEENWDIMRDNGMLLLCLSLWNNMGHINHSLLNRQDMQICVKWMEDLLRHVQDSDAEHEDVLFFYLTASLTTKEGLLSIAPAA